MKNLKFLLGICCFMPGLTSYAKNYYFSNSSGNDSRTILEAQNIATPWKSIQRLNNFANQLSAGDSILFKRGDSFYGSILINMTGNQRLPIIFTAYGSGSNPIISGFTTVGSWVNVGSNIWESASAVSTLNTCNMVVVNGVFAQLGRYPNANAANGGYLNYNTTANNAAVKCAGLQGQNWTGADVLLKVERYIMRSTKVLSLINDTLTFNAIAGYNPKNNYGLFIQNDLRTLDVPNEWYFDPSTKKIRIFSTASPLNVQVSSVDTLVRITANNITISDINFIGSNKETIAKPNSFSYSNITIKKCNINFSGLNGIHFNVGDNLNITIDSCNIQNTNNNAIVLGGGCRNAKITNCVILNTGTYPGMGNDTYTGIRTDGKSTLIERNVVKNTGFNGIRFGRDSSIIKNNLIDTFCTIMDDGGGIYTYIGPSNDKWIGRRIEGNIILNGIGSVFGTNNSAANSASANGIYLDDNTTGVSVINNTIANCQKSGILINNGRNNNLKSNTCYNNFFGLELSHNNFNAITGMDIKNNSFIAKLTTQYAASFFSHLTNANNIGVLDSNLYTRPILDNATIKMEFPDMGWGFRTLAHWKTYSGKDNLSTVSKVKLLPYIIDSLLGLNLVENGLFKDNIIGIETFSLKNTSIIYYDKIKLDNGSIRIEALNDCNTIVNISSVSNTKKYMLRFTSAANIDFNMEVYLRSGTAPFNIISRINPIKISAHRNDYEIIFNNPTTNSKAAIIFSIKNEPVTFWLDNIELVEAVVRPTVPAEVFRFEYNTTAKIKKLALNGIFIGMDSTIYNDTLSLAPFSSKVLLKVNNIVSKIGSPLPVKLLNFVINDAKDEVKVNWVTTQEINSNYYVIERSTDGKKFETIGQVISNNKVTTNNYQFKDFKPIDGTSYYRLVMVDKDGSKAYSSIIALKKNSTALFISNMAVAESKLQFQINSNAKQLLNYIIVDVAGRLFYKNSIILQKGANSITQQIESLDKNMYYLKLVTSQENIVKSFLNR